MTATQNPAQDVSELALRVACMVQLREVERQYPDTGKAIREYLTLVVDERMRLWEAARELQQAQSGVLLEDTLEWIHNSPDLTKENFSKATAELQQAQVVGGKIANGHHCGLPERLCNHPSHTTPQSSVQVVGEIVGYTRSHDGSHPITPDEYKLLVSCGHGEGMKGIMLVDPLTAPQSSAPAANSLKEITEAILDSSNLLVSLVFVSGANPEWARPLPLDESLEWTCDTSETAYAYELLDSNTGEIKKRGMLTAHVHTGPDVTLHLDLALHR